MTDALGGRRLWRFTCLLRASHRAASASSFYCLRPVAAFLYLFGACLHLLPPAVPRCTITIFAVVLAFGERCTGASGAW